MTCPEFPTSRRPPPYLKFLTDRMFRVPYAVIKTEQDGMSRGKAHPRNFSHALADELCFRVLRELRTGRQTVATLRQRLPKTVALHGLEECLGKLMHARLIVRSRVGITDQLMLNRDGILSVIAQLSECASELSEIDSILARAFAGETGTVLQTPRLFWHEERVRILEAIATQPYMVGDLAQHLTPCVSIGRIRGALNVFETAGLVSSKGPTNLGWITGLEFSATPLGIETLRILRDLDVGLDDRDVPLLPQR